MNAFDVCARLSRSPNLLTGAVAVSVTGAGWALLCLLLATGGHSPSVTLVPIPRDEYYLAQSAFVLPLLFAQWMLCAWVTHRVARRLGGRGAWMGTANVLGVALAAPLLVLFVVPDLLAYILFGFAALGRLVRVTAPLSFLATLGMATLAVRAAHAIPSGKAFLAGTAGVLAQAALGALLLR